jgi:hypothetical protein
LQQFVVKFELVIEFVVVVIVDEQQRRRGRARGR